MIVYGKNVFDQLSSRPDQIEEVYVQNGLTDKKILNALAKAPYLKRSNVSKAALDRMTEHGVHQGIAAKVKEIPLLSLDRLLERTEKKPGPGFLVALDGIQDPQNLGAMLRTCDAAGVQGVLLPKNRSASLTPSAIKASTGAAYTVPIASVTNLSAALQQLKERGYWIVGTGFEGARDYREGLYDVPVVLVIGNEGKGISPQVRKQCDYLVKLPMRGTVQSLNASVAAAILIYEICRQRDLKQ